MMDVKELEFVYAADELYSAFCQTAGAGAIGSRQRAALEEFARACNAWTEHPGKLAERQRRSDQ